MGVFIPRGNSIAFDYGRCRGCGEYVFWGETVKGKRIPIQYAGQGRIDPAGEKLFALNLNWRLLLINAVRGEGDTSLYVSHHVTCPKAGRFRK